MKIPSEREVQRLIAAGAGYWNYRPWSFQKEIRECRARQIVVPAGTGTGKTVEGVDLLLKKIYTWPDEDYGILSPTNVQANRMLINHTHGPVNVLTNLLRLGTYNQTKRTIMLPQGGHVYFLSGDSPESVHGIHLRWLWVDEAGMIDDALLRTAMTRVALHNGDVYLDGYPQSSGGYYEQLVNSGLNHTDPDVQVFRTTSLKSPYMTKRALDFLRANLSEHQWQMMVLGEFARAEGAVYPSLSQYSLNEYIKKCLGLDHTPTAEERTDWEISNLQVYGGADGGSTTAGVMIGWEGTRCWVLGARQLDGETFETNAKAWKDMGLAKRAQVIHGDPSAKTQWVEMQRYGVRVASYHGGPGSVRTGIDRVRSLCNTNQKTPMGEELPLLVADSDMIGISTLRAQWDGYTWHTDTSGHQVGDEPRKENDHCLDALRYAVLGSRPPKSAMQGPLVIRI